MEIAEVQRRTKILVVDDEQPITSLLACILEREGYETATAYTGESAIGAAYSFRPDCLLSDIDMPTMNGVEAAIEILTLLPSCKVLFVSGHVSCLEILEQAAVQGYHFEVLPKPIHPTELLKKVSQILCCSPSAQT